jgi:uncharacterized repeat protein (TIGR01451 family)
MRVAMSNLLCNTVALLRDKAKSAGAFWPLAALACILALLLPLGLQAQTNYVYVNNRTATSNSISAFSVDTGGLLTAVPGSPFSSGGIGANVSCSAVDRITVNGTKNLMFVANSGDQTISVLQIAPATGALTAIAGSPFASGLTLDSCQGISLAATPNGSFLMASSNGQINTFAVAAGGQLSLIATSATLPTPMAGMKISGNGQFLAISQQSNVSVFTINADGSLTAVAGSPFSKTGTGLVGGLEFNCDGTLLYAGEGSGTTSLTDAWTVAANGALSPIAGSPVSAAGADSNVVFLTPDNTLLFQSDQVSNDLNAFTVNADGTLTSIGVFSIAAAHRPVGMASDNSGLFLYAADDAFGLAVFNIVPGVVPTLVGDTAIVGAGQIQGMAAYPPRSCAHTDLAITQTATPNPATAGGDVTYTINVTNNGPNTLSVAINDLLPRTSVTFVSCTPGPGGVCDKGSGLNRTITFASLASGQTGTASIVAAIPSTLLNGDTITNTALVSNSSAVDTNPANNSATTVLTVSAPMSATTLTPAAASGTYFGTTTLSATLKRTLPSAVIAGRTVTFSVLGVAMGTATTNAAGIATLPNVNLAGISAATYVGGITVTFAGDSQFQVSTGSSTLTVNKSVLTVTAQNATKIYGDANPAFTFVITGFLNNETPAVTSGSPNCGTTASVNSPAGPFTITCPVATLAATNYTFTFVPATLSITRASLVLAGNSVSRLYGDPNPAVTGVVTGLKAGDKANATFTTAALSTSPVGTYPINGALVPLGGFSIANYILTSSGAVTVAPAPLTATSANATRLYGDPNPAFTGTITGLRNGDVLTVTFASTATQASNVGTYPITATLVGAAAGNYTVASSSTLTVSQVPLTVSAANASRLYGDPNPAFTGAITGLKNADNITATYSSADSTSPIGTYAIVIALLDPTAKLGNYTVTSTNGSLTVSPAPLTVAAANAIRLYGDPNPLFTGTLTGIKNGDNITATYSSADPTSPVGTYSIVPTLADPTLRLGNYTLISTNGTLTVSPAALTVSAANFSRPYGDLNPAFTGTIAGIKNGDQITATFASTATASSPVGAYPVVITLADPTAKLGNYTLTSTNGTLTVSPAALNVTGASVARVYGDPNPAFIGTIAGIKNGDQITVTFASAATQASAAGTYPIVPTLADPTTKLGNYTVISTNGTLTVSQAPLTVTAANATRLFGDPNPAFTGTLTGLKNSDSITATFSSAATPTSPVGTYPIVPTLVDPNGKLSNYAVTSINGILTLKSVPSAVSVTPSAGSGKSQIFQMAYSDPAGFAAITQAEVIINRTLTFTGSCSALYTASTQTLQIVNDNGQAFGVAAKIGVAGTLQNSQCSIDLGASSALGVGNNLTLKLAMTFTPTFTGLKSTFLQAFNKFGLNSGFQTLGTWVPPTPSSTVSVTPSAVSGTSQILQLVYSDLAGFGAITQAEVLINSKATFPGSCAAVYTASTQTLQIVNDDGRAFGVAAKIGVAGSLQNSQCSIDLGASSASGVGNNLNLNLAVTINQSFAGTKNIFLQAFNKFGLASGWQAHGTWTLAPLPSSAVSVTPSAGSGLSQNLQLAYSDPGGFGAITAAEVLISSTRTFVGSCSAVYTASTQTLQIINDDGRAFGVAAKLGVAGTLQNSQCSIDLGASSASGVGNNLTLNLAVTLNQGFAGVKSIFLQAFNKFGLTSGWQTRGTWTLAPIPTSPVSVTPSVGTGISQIFQLVYSDPTGFGAITQTETIINGKVTYTGSCAAAYTASTQTLAIMNDNGQAFGVAAKIGVAGTLQNSQCSIDLGASSASGVGNNLTLNLAVTFKPSFVGSKSIFMQAQNKFGANSGWQTMGTWLP